jgi:Fuc2NAc and GlcNAc transferase
MKELTIFLGTLAFSVVLAGFVRRHALERRILDLPNSRSSHAVPTPRGGGIAIVVPFVTALCALSAWELVDIKTTLTLIAASCAIAGVGYIDDRRQLDARLRLAVHLLTAVAFVAVLGGLPESELVRWGLGGFWVGSALAVLALVWGTNLFNFMDGIDGIAASESIFISSGLALLNWLDGGTSGVTDAMLSLSAGSLGCLVWNWPPARMFMGDVGSGFLGFILTALAMLSNRRGGIPIEVLPILGGVFLVDATITLVRRILRGDRWLEAHRMHAYQHLARRFGSHKPVTLIVIAINLVWLLPCAFAANRFPDNARMVMVVALLPLVIFTVIAGSGKREA